MSPIPSLPSYPSTLLLRALLVPPFMRRKWRRNERDRRDCRRAASKRRATRNTGTPPCARPRARVRGAAPRTGEGRRRRHFVALKRAGGRGPFPLTVLPLARKPTGKTDNINTTRKSSLEPEQKNKFYKRYLNWKVIYLARGKRAPHTFLTRVGGWGAVL